MLKIHIISVEKWLFLQGCVRCSVLLLIQIDYSILKEPSVLEPECKVESDQTPKQGVPIQHGNIKINTFGIYCWFLRVSVLSEMSPSLSADVYPILLFFKIIVIFSLHAFFTFRFEPFTKNKFSLKIFMVRENCYSCAILCKSFTRKRLNREIGILHFCNDSNEYMNEYVQCLIVSTWCLNITNF